MQIEVTKKCTISVNLKMACFIRQIFQKCNKIPQLKHQNLFSKIISTPLVPTCQNLYSNAPTPYEIVDQDAQDKLTKTVINNVNTQIADQKQGRLFAVVHVAGKQFKVTDGDVVVIEGYWPPNVGDKISLDKVLLAGGTDFTLVGRPIVQKGLVKVEATVIEKTVSHTKTHFRKKRRKQYKRINFYRIPQTFLRINRVQIEGELNNPPEVRGLETAVF